MYYKRNIPSKFLFEGTPRGCIIRSEGKEALWSRNWSHWSHVCHVYLLADARAMVEESINSGNKPTKTKTARPKPVYFWSVVDVQKWLRRHCSDYCNLYSDNFLQHEITGRALIRINENTLLRIGIENSVHRREIWREIMKLRLKTDIMEIRDLERQNNTIYFD